MIEANHRMPHSRYFAPLAAAFALVSSLPLFAQAPGVEVVCDRGEEYAALVEQANECRLAGKLLPPPVLLEQLTRTSCVVNLPKPATRQLTPRQIWQRSKEAHVRLGWHYLCNKCDKWHLNLAGGCFLTADGVIATCYHVVKPNPEHREAYLVAADDQNNLLPVTEVLAGNALADTAIVRAKVKSPVKPLALNTKVYPGDGAWCYSDPLGRSSYFSEGMVNRFYYRKAKDKEGPCMEVSTAWAPGSSGSAVVDACANVIGLVSAIWPSGPSNSNGTNQASKAASPAITFHCASRAADVLALVKSATRD
jgi:hypothetical protein